VEVVLSDFGEKWVWEWGGDEGGNMAMELEGWVTQCRSLGIPIPPTADLAWRRSMPMKGSVLVATYHNELSPRFNLGNVPDIESTALSDI